MLKLVHRNFLFLPSLPGTSTSICSFTSYESWSIIGLFSTWFVRVDIKYIKSIRNKVLSNNLDDSAHPGSPILGFHISFFKALYKWKILEWNLLNPNVQMAIIYDNINVDKRQPIIIQSKALVTPPSLLKIEFTIAFSPKPLEVAGGTQISFEVSKTWKLSYTVW